MARSNYSGYSRVEGHCKYGNDSFGFIKVVFILSSPRRLISQEGPWDSVAFRDSRVLRWPGFYSWRQDFLFAVLVSGELTAICIMDTNDSFLGKTSLSVNLPTPENLTNNNDRDSNAVRRQTIRTFIAVQTHSTQWCYFTSIPKCTSHP